MTPTATYISEACRLYIMLVLTASVAGKATALEGFRETIGELFPIPRAWTPAAALGVIGVEALIALLLLAGSEWARLGMVAALALFGVFTAVIIVALVQRRAVNCNCFGGRSHVISAHDLVRNATLIAASGAYFLGGPVAGGLGWADYLLLFGVAVIVVLISTNLDDIVLLLR
ncbi:MAG: hypothetical protein Q8Q88_15905 [Phenylobacterium sp.]|uniref:MauE/DoxX family redox-associated membrane protein n=1 Tax=Phenylobacterium sp. TaxID=1871053 RepID=UPI00273557E4|nr:MauE/DoxX family redox-associated membrane protein [Phenylobacterium sp.]MDP3748524.1 hypothetical protein [Phenylobacterium sp.]